MATTYLLDTNAFSDAMRENRKLVSRLTTLSGAGTVVISTIVRGEICYGLQSMPRGRRRDNYTSKALQLFRAIPCEPIPESAGDHYARIKCEVETKGLRLDENDMWIAATACALDAVLVTRDTDFRRVRGLLTIDWSK
jgi:tRNA(fMet)-specific endonuclease VapC